MNNLQLNWPNLETLKVLCGLMPQRRQGIIT